MGCVGLTQGFLLLFAVLDRSRSLTLLPLGLVPEGKHLPTILDGQDEIGEGDGTLEFTRHLGP